MIKAVVSELSSMCPIINGCYQYHVDPLYDMPRNWPSQIRTSIDGSHKGPLCMRI